MRKNINSVLLLLLFTANIFRLFSTESSSSIRNKVNYRILEEAIIKDLFGNDKNLNQINLPNVLTEHKILLFLGIENILEKLTLASLKPIIKKTDSGNYKINSDKIVIIPDNLSVNVFDIKTGTLLYNIPSSSTPFSRYKRHFGLVSNDVTKVALFDRQGSEDFESFKTQLWDINAKKELFLKNMSLGEFSPDSTKIVLFEPQNLQAIFLIQQQVMN